MKKAFTLLVLVSLTTILMAQAQTTGKSGKAKIHTQTDQLKLELQQNQKVQQDQDRLPNVSPGTQKPNGVHYSHFQNQNNRDFVIWDNGPIITDSLAGSNGSHYSRLQDTTLGMGTFGFGCQHSAGNSVADDFEVTGTLIPYKVTFYAYQTGSGPPSTITEIYVQVWDGNPTTGGSVIFGDMSTNILESTQWSNIWRVNESDPAENRPIMEIHPDLSGLILQEGTYWIEVSIDGTGASGPWMPPVTIVGETETGNAIQNQDGDWVPLEDVGAQGMPFVIETNPGVPDNDVRLKSILQPESGIGLTNAESIEVEIINFGQDTQYEIPYFITWSGPTGSDTIYGTYFGELQMGDEAIILLTETVNLSEYGNYQFVACTLLEGDEYPENDCTTKNVLNSEPSLCIENLYSSGCGFGDGLIYWSLQNIEVPDIPCFGNPEWYHDYTDQVHGLNAGQTHELTVMAGYDENYFDVWIDYNDDLYFSDDELVLNDAFCPLANTFYVFDIEIQDNPPPGQHFMRYRTNWTETVDDPCETYSYGNCSDFSADMGYAAILDVGVESIDMLSFQNPGVIEPKATVANYGMEPQSFAVEMDFGYYTSTKYVSDLMQGTTQQVTFDSVNISYGTFVATACTQLEGDENTANDCKAKPIVVFGAQNCYAYIAEDNSGTWVEGPAMFNLETPIDLIQLAPTSINEIITGACWAADYWWGCQQGGGLYWIDHATGDMTFVGDGPALNGIAFDGITVYGASATELFEIDPATGQGTLIGTLGNAGGQMMGIACNENGDLFGFDVGDDTFYSIDKATGATTAIGPLGFDFEGPQDMAFNKATGQCYITGFTTAGGLYSVDVNTGAASLLGEFPNGIRLTGFAIPVAAPPPVGDPPQGFNAQFVEDVGVECSWGMYTPNEYWLGYDDGVNAGGMGSSGGEFYTAIRWDTVDLIPFNGFAITEFKFFPLKFANNSEITFKMWEDTNASFLIYEQALENLNWNEWNTIALDEPQVVNASKELWVGFDVLAPNGEDPIGRDAGPAVAGYGDMVSFDGTTWESLSINYGLDFNYNLKILVEENPDSKINSISGNPKSEFLGVNIYRDGNLVNGTLIEPGVEQYTDPFFEPGTWTYSARAVYDDGLSDPTPGVEVIIPTGPQIAVEPDELNEVHNAFPQVSARDLVITNTGDEPLEWEIDIELESDTEQSRPQPMDPVEYARLLKERQASEGYVINDVQPGVVPGTPQSNGNHYSKYQGANGSKDIVFDNGPFITAEGVGSNGSDYSELQDASLGMGTYGSGCQISAGNSLADDFELTGPHNIPIITFYAYQTGSGPPSTIDDVRVQVYDGDPSNGGNVIYGDLNTNVLLSTEWTNVWRVLESGPSENRPIMEVVAETPGLALTAGTYWLEVQVGGTGASGPWMPPVTIVGETETGNALQNQSGVWTPLVDVSPQGIPFQIWSNGLPQGNDVGVWSIVEPTSGVYLGDEESVIIKIQNYGDEIQTEIPWQVSYSGPTGSDTFSGTWTGSLASGESVEVTLTETVDMSILGQYEFEACTQLPGDDNPDNDCKNKLIECMEPSLCIENLYSSGCSFGDGLISWNFAEVDVPDIPCSGTPEWYHDYTDLIHYMSPGETYILTVSAGYSETNFDVWIDWNDDLLLTDDELILDNAECIEANFPYTFDVTIPINGSEGDHIFRLRTNWIDPVMDACETYTYGNCCDFKANTDTGIQPEDWLSVDIDSGTIQPGESEVVMVTFDSENYTSIFSGSINISSNDPVNPLVEVPATLVAYPSGPLPIFEPFEDYNADDYLVQQAVSQGKEYWTTWSGNPGSTEDPFVSDDQAYTGNNSMLIEGANDAILIMPENFNSGGYKIDFRIFIPTGKTGYFNCLQMFAGTNSEWGMQTFFDVGGIGSVDAGGEGAGAFTYAYNTWHHVEIIIDLDADNAEMYLNDDMIVEWVWSSGNFGTGTLNEFHAINFYAWADNGTPGAFFDDIDIMFAYIPPIPNPPTNLTATVDDDDVILEWDYAGIFDPQWITYSNEAITNSIGTNAAANFDVAARWDATFLEQYENGAVTKINFVPAEPGDICTYTLKVWSGNDNPTLIYDQELTDIVPDVWNEIMLDMPVPFDNSQELWIGFNCNTTSGYPAGCDDGPQDEGWGNMMFWEGEWTTLTALNPALTYNWAIQGYIEYSGNAEELLPIEGEPVIVENAGELSLNPIKISPPAILFPDEEKSATFNVYRDDIQIASGVPTTYYTDEDIPFPNFAYFVTAVVDGIESEPSNEVYVYVPGIVEEELSIQLFPNPSDEFLIIDSKSRIFVLTIFDINGLKVYAEKPSENKLQINTSQFPPGIYTLQLETEQGMSVHKVVVR